MMIITKEWFERRAKAEADLEIGAGFSVVNMTDDDIARMEVVAERGLPQWAQDELSKLRAALASRDVTEEPVDADEEMYEIGKRDGYEEAVQEIDQLTGGDGEYRYCTDRDPERHTPDAATMILRIVDRFETLNTLDEAIKAEEYIQPQEPVAWLPKRRWERMTAAEPWLTNIVYSEDQSKFFECVPLYASPPYAYPSAVKVLVWEDYEWTSEANSAFGEYRIHRHYKHVELQVQASSSFSVAVGKRIELGSTATLEDLKAAAQADFETRARSTLARPLPLPREEKMREALEKIAGLERHVEKLQDVVKAECACSYDRPDDVCLFHGKMKAEARADGWKAAIEAACSAIHCGCTNHCDFDEAEDKIRALSSEHGKVTE